MPKWISEEGKDLDSKVTLQKTILWSFVNLTPDGHHILHSVRIHNPLHSQAQNAVRLPLHVFASQILYCLYYIMQKTQRQSDSGAENTQQQLKR